MAATAATAAAAAQEEEEFAAAAQEEEEEPNFAPAVPGAPSARVNYGVSGIGQGEGSGHAAASKGSSAAHAHTNNNYVRSEGQNVGNFISGRPTSRVLAPPWGRSSITFG